MEKHLINKNKRFKKFNIISIVVAVLIISNMVFKICNAGNMHVVTGENKKNEPTYQTKVKRPVAYSLEQANEIYSEDANKIKHIQNFEERYNNTVNNYYTNVFNQQNQSEFSYDGHEFKLSKSYEITENKKINLNMLVNSGTSYSNSNKELAVLDISYKTANKNIFNIDNNDLDYLNDVLELIGSYKINTDLYQKLIDNYRVSALQSNLPIAMIEDNGLRYTLDTYSISDGYEIVFQLEQ